MEPIRLSEAAGILLTGCIVALFCLEEFIAWWNTNDDGK